MKTAIELVADERLRQTEVLGWSSAFDDIQNNNNQIAIAASCYCLPVGQRDFRVREQWPWGYEWWKPTPDDRIREIVKAGALIVAEIERLQRLRDAPNL